MNSLQQIARLIKEKDNYYIVGHIDPDGDCIGSMVALREIIKKYNKKCRLIFYEKPDDKYNFILNEDYCLYSLLKKDEEINWTNINIIALDAGDLQRIGDIAEEKKEILINIDHHPDNPKYAAYNYIDSNAAAVGEILYKLLKKMNIKIDIKIGTAIATAILYDTGFLRYQNTSAKVLKIIAKLMENGVDLYKINKEIYGSYPFNNMKLQGLALSTLELEYEGKVAWLHVDEKMFSETNSDIKDISGFVNYARDIKNVEVGICFSEINEKETRVSFRSQENVPVNKIAEKFLGGGHPRAAGCTVKENLNKAIKLVLQEVKRFVR